MLQRYPVKLFVLFLVTVGFLQPVFGQKETTKMNQEVEVVKAYKPSVSNAEKINLLPEISDTTRFRPDLNYKTNNHPVTSGFQSSVLKASNLLRSEISYPGIGKISGGFGTNLTPFFDFYLNNPGSTNGTLGLLFNHLSSRGSVDLKGGSKTDAPFSYNKAAVFGSYVYEGITISSQISYQRDMNRFYGYPVAIPTDIMTDNFVKYFNQDQLNQTGFFDLSLKSNATSAAQLKFNTNINLGYFNTSTTQVEKAMRFKGDFSYEFATFSGKLAAGYDHFETENITQNPDFPGLISLGSSWLQLSPSAFYQNEMFTLEGGLNLYSVYDNQNGTIFKLYPNLDFVFHTADKNFSLYAGLKGHLENNNYSKIAKENRWIDPVLLVKPTSHLSTFSAGIKGKIAIPLAFDFGVKYGKTDDQYFYVTRIENRTGNPAPALTDLTYNNAFDVVYNNLSTLDFSGDLSYTTSNMFLLLSGHFYNYQLNSLEKAPYMPDFTLNAATEFKVTGPVSAQAEIYLTGPRNVMLEYYLPPWSSAMSPPPIYLPVDAMIDVNIGAKYRFPGKFEVFGKVENLMNRKDEIWYGYTVQGIRFKLGASFSF
jgi:hypothetical protein